MQGQGLITLMQITHFLEMFLENPKQFENRFFLVVPLHKKAHAIMCTIRIRMGDKCVDLFHKYLNKDHFLMGNGLYVY